MKEEEIKVIEYTIDDSGYLGVHAMTVKDFIKEMDDLEHPSLTITLVE